MEISKDIFKLSKSPNEKHEQIGGVQNTSSLTEEERKKYYFSEGKSKAQDMGGAPSVIRPQLEAVYIRVQQEIKQNEIEQEQRKQPYRDKLSQLEAQKNNVEEQIKQKENDLKLEEKKIEDSKQQIIDIKNDPSIVTKSGGDGKSTIIVGGLILCFLTIYLFVFYSSAAFSAFFKTFSINELGISDAIFDAEAISKAFSQGIMASVLVLTIPFIFLGLGFLLFKFSESERGYMKFIKVFCLIVVTFIFDFILAHEICSKIYNLLAENSFQDMPPYSVKMSFTNINFWMIIFSGFVVYIIWGLVFSVVMKAMNPYHRVRIAIEQIEKKIADYKETCKSIKNELLKIKNELGKINSDINNTNNILSNTIVTKADVTLEINNFVSGWLAYMEFRTKPQEDRDEVVRIKEQFLGIIESNFKVE